MGRQTFAKYITDASTYITHLCCDDSKFMCQTMDYIWIYKFHGQMYMWILVLQMMSGLLHSRSRQTYIGTVYRVYTLAWIHNFGSWNVFNLFKTYFIGENYVVKQQLYCLTSNRVQLTCKYMVRLLYAPDYGHVQLSSLDLWHPSHNKIHHTPPSTFHAVQIAHARSWNKATSASWYYLL